MKNKCFKLAYLLAAIIMAVNIGFVIHDSISFSMDDLPKGRKIYTIESPHGDKKLNVYYIRNSLGDAVRADIDFDGISRNVYWQTGIDGVDSGWLDESVVDINGVDLNVDLGADYDCRRGYSIFKEGSIEGKDVEGAVKTE